MRIDDQLTVDFLEKRVIGLKPSMMLFGGSAHTWRKRLDTMVLFLTGVRRLILPSSLRPGGATYYFELWDENLPRLQWRGRWASTKMLEHYVQELVGCQILNRVSASYRSKMDALAALYPAVLSEFCAASKRST